MAHEVTEGHQFLYEVDDHPARADSPTYIKSRKLMVELSQQYAPWGASPWQDHHSGLLWAYDGKSWFTLRNNQGVEWSSQFAADPTKIELLRQNAMRLYARFPETLDQFDKLGFPEQRVILATEVKTADDVAQWTDSIFNASMPLPQPVHTGTIDSRDGSQPIAGIHGYPLPIWDIQFFKHEDFCLGVTDSEGHPAAVVPLAPKGSGDGRVQVIHAHPDSELHRGMSRSHENGEAHIVSADHPLAQQAFKRQT